MCSFILIVSERGKGEWESIQGVLSSAVECSGGGTQPAGPIGQAAVYRQAMDSFDDLCRLFPKAGTGVMSQCAIHKRRT